MDKEPEQLEFEFMNELDDVILTEEMVEEIDQMASSSGC